MKQETNANYSTKKLLHLVYCIAVLKIPLLDEDC